MWYGGVAGGGLRSVGVKDTSSSKSGCSILPTARRVRNGALRGPVPPARSRTSCESCKPLGANFAEFAFHALRCIRAKGGGPGRLVRGGGDASPAPPRPSTPPSRGAMRDTPRLGPRVGRRGDILPAGPECFLPQMGQILAALLLCRSVCPVQEKQGRERAKERGLHGGPAPSLCGLCCCGCRSFGRSYTDKPFLAFAWSTRRGWRPA